MVVGGWGTEMESSKVSLSFFRLWTCWHYICPRRNSLPHWYVWLHSFGAQCPYPQVCLVPQGGGYLGPYGCGGPVATRMSRLVLGFQENVLCSPRCPCWKRPCGVRTHTSARLGSWYWLCCLMELATTSGRGVYFHLTVRVDHGKEDHMAHGCPGLCLLFVPNYQ